MSDKSTMIKEAREYLEDAQKDVVKTLNSETSFLSRLFSSVAKDNLKAAQSSISKAINQLNNIKDDGNSIVGKLQKHISERDEKIKKAETEAQEKSKIASTLEDQIKVLEARIEDLQKRPELKEEVASSNPQEEHTEVNKEDQLRESIEKLESKNTFLKEKLDQNFKELKDSNELVLEFSNRMKRLKSELTCK